MYAARTARLVQGKLSCKFRIKLDNVSYVRPGLGALPCTHGEMPEHQTPRTPLAVARLGGVHQPAIGRYLTWIVMLYYLPGLKIGLVPVISTRLITTSLVAPADSSQISLHYGMPMAHFIGCLVIRSYGARPPASHRHRSTRAPDGEQVAFRECTAGSPLDLARLAGPWQRSGATAAGAARRFCAAQRHARPDPCQGLLRCRMPHCFPRVRPKVSGVGTWVGQR